MHSEYKVFGSFIFYYYYFYFCSLIQLDFIVSLPEILEICPTKKKKKNHPIWQRYYDSDSHQ